VPTPQRVLVIEDDAAIRRGLVDALRFESYHVFEAATAKDGVESALAVDCDLILLDLRLPGGDGLSVLKQVRASKPTLPVIILTARGDEADRIAGLRLGADDYVVKPFSVKELMARIAAVLRRSPARPLDIRRIAFPDMKMEVDLLRRELRFQTGERAELSDMEVDFLRYLAANPSRAISRDELLRHVWHIEPRGSDTRTVDMHVARLREKFCDNGAQPRLLLTVRGKGYMFSASAVIPESRP
jgi:two-component system, OmpR family, alkaline phosphatase synthesis response regulator PhoP